MKRVKLTYVDCQTLSLVAVGEQRGKRGYASLKCRRWTLTRRVARIKLVNGEE